MVGTGFTGSLAVIRGPNPMRPVPVLAALSATAAGVVAGSPALVVGPCFGLVAWSRWLRVESVDRRRRRLQAELPPYLDELAQRLGSGASLPQALRVTEGGPTLDRWLVPLRVGLSIGLGLRCSIEVLRDRAAGEPGRPATLDLLIDALHVLVVRGGPARPSLERLNDTVRSAAWIDSEARVQAGQANASAVLLAGLPILFAAGLALLDPRLARFYAFDPLGAACLLSAACLAYGGWRWMGRLTRPRGGGGSSGRLARPPVGVTPPSRWRLGSALGSPQVRVAGCTAAGIAVAVAMGSAVAGLVVASAVVAWMRSTRRRQRATDHQALVDALPAAIDRCMVVLGSGGTIRDCLEALARTGPDCIRLPAAEAVARTRRGHRLDQALRWLQLELGPAFQPLTGALLLAREQGGDVGELLARLSFEADASRRRAGELHARRLPVALLVPLVTCSLPAVIVGAVVPLAIVAFSGIDL